MIDWVQDGASAGGYQIAVEIQTEIFLYSKHKDEITLINSNCLNISEPLK